jgi:hypothetical protein
MHFIEDATIPQYLARHLYNVTLLIPYSRQRVGKVCPPSASFNNANIWLSENLDFFIQNLLSKSCKNFLLPTSINLREDYPTRTLSSPVRGVTDKD